MNVKNSHNIGVIRVHSVSSSCSVYHSKMVHNHPSGDPTPSKDDVAMTKAVAAAAEKLGILLHDHVVVGRKGHKSMRSLGLLG